MFSQHLEKEAAIDELVWQTMTRLMMSLVVVELRPLMSVSGFDGILEVQLL